MYAEKQFPTEKNVSVEKSHQFSRHCYQIPLDVFIWSHTSFCP